MKLKNIIPIFISLFTLFLLIQFRTVPVSQFWKGYRILYVFTEDLSESDILTILEKHGCDSVISQCSQRVPLVSPVAPIQAQGEESYLYKRNGFFTDKNHRALIFYIPDNQAVQLDKVIRELSAFKGSSAGTDGKSSFPWLAPIICTLLFALLFLFSQNKMLYFAGTAFFILFAFSRPLFLVSAAVSFYLFAFFIFHRIWARKDFFKTALNSSYVLLFAISPILILLISSPIHSVFYIFTLLASASLVFLYTNFSKKQETRRSFQPVFIRSARMIPLLGHLGIRLLFGLLLSLILIFAAFKFAGNVSDFSSSSMPSLPSPVTRNDSELVQLKDFVDWSWNSVTFPYKKLSENSYEIPKEGEVVSITDYQEENGKIVPVKIPAFVYNSDFRESVYKSVEKLDYPALEKMLLKQGKNAHFAYSKNASSSTKERFASLLILVFITISVALGINYIIGRKRYGLSI